MKKKNGFISTSVIYSFFLIFVTLFLALILNYMHSKLLINRINESAYNDIDKIKNARLSNLNIGDYVLFELKDNHSDIINEEVYILANTYDDGRYEFYTTTNTFNSSYNNNDKMISINNFNDEANNIIASYKYSDTNTNMHIGFITTSSLRDIRNKVEDINILDDIYDTGTDYIVYNNIASSYENNSYYNLRKYALTSDNTADLFNESSPDSLSELLASYCNLTYTNSSLLYPQNNIFGYGNVLTATISSPRYINYCYYANYENYSHDVKDGIVTHNETVPSDLIPNDNPAVDESTQKKYFYRGMLTLNINDSSESDYFVAGKGTLNDPYILRTGGKE